MIGQTLNSSVKWDDGRVGSSPSNKQKPLFLQLLLVISKTVPVPPAQETKGALWACRGLGRHVLALVPIMRRPGAAWRALWLQRTDVGPTPRPPGKQERIAFLRQLTGCLSEGVWEN